MSGGPPHHPHNRQVPGTNLGNSAWTHRLQIPNFFPRQPQLAHMSNEHSLFPQATWHTPTTEALKMHPHTHVLNEMFKNESLFPRDCVDLSLTRNGNQNGEIPPVPISLSVRDTNKINSLPPSALEIQAVELTKSTSPVGKPASPAIMSNTPGIRSTSPAVRSTSPAVRSTSPAVRPTSPTGSPSGLKSASPGLRSIPPSYPKANSPSLISINTTTSIFLPSSSVLATARNITSAGSPIPKSASPGLKSSSPGLKPSSPSLKSSLGIQGLPLSTTVDIVKTQKRSNVRVDSILERLNPTLDKTIHIQERRFDEKPKSAEETTAPDKHDKPFSVIVQPTSNFDDNSNSNPKEDDTISTNSNDDSLDSTKSRRKRKPSKTIRVSKDDEKLEECLLDTVDNPSKEPELQPIIEKDPISIMGEMLEDNKNPEKGESSNELEELIPSKPRRKTSSESETIDDIAAMVQEGLKEKEQKQQKPLEEDKKDEAPAKPISVSVIKTKENLTEVLSDNSITPGPVPTPAILTPAEKKINTPAEKKVNTPFLEVEDKLEEMFAGIEDSSDPLKSTPLNLDDSKLEDQDPLLKLDDPILPSNEEDINEEAVAPSQDIKEDIEKTVEKEESPAATINSEVVEEKKPVTTTKKTKRKASSAATIPTESTPKKKKISKNTKLKTPLKGSVKKAQKPKPSGKNESVKEVYAYDSGSNTSSTKSKGPFIQIKGPRESPFSVNVINSSFNDEDGDRRLPKVKKFHDDIEYRQKGLHSSTLSNKYDAQTKDASWICAFCKRGPHASELSGPTYDRNIIPPGDLFGPYFITTQCPEFERRLDDPYDRQFKSRKVTKALDAEAAPLLKGKKSKRKHSDDTLSYEPSIYHGITETSNKTFEVWAHEDCIVWSQGTYLVGAKIIGLEEAVWNCCNVTCKSCHLKGANISCLRRGCLNSMHLCCARANNWQFLENNFKSYCPEHRIP